MDVAYGYLDSGGNHQTLIEARANCSDEDILNEIESMPPLPDETDPRWYDASDNTLTDLLCLHLALGDLAEQRRLVPALLPLLQKACYGDPYDLQQGIRHNLEAIAGDDMSALVDVCLLAATHSRPGTRLWAIFELGILRDPRSFDTLRRSLRDEAEEVRATACRALLMLCQTHSECRPDAIRALTQFIEGTSDDRESLLAREYRNEIEQPH
jgi:hypothetical protein